MARGIRNGDYVKVIWVDSATLGTWTDLEKAESLTSLDCITVGHLLNRHDKFVRLIGTATPDNVALHALCIPKVCVTSITRLIEEPE